MKSIQFIAHVYSYYDSPNGASYHTVEVTRTDNRERFKSEIDDRSNFIDDYQRAGLAWSEVYIIETMLHKKKDFKLRAKGVRRDLDGLREFLKGNIRGEFDGK